MKLLLESEFRELFPDSSIAIVWGEANGRRPDFEKSIVEMQRKAFSVMQTSLKGQIVEDLRIATWRDAYRVFGTNPNKHKPTHEALVRRLLKAKGEWPSCNSIVDIYLVNEAQWVLPHGGYDVTEVEGILTLGRSVGGEPFVDRKGNQEYTEKGEVVYRDKSSVLTRRWNYMDGRKGAIRESTRQFLLCIESPSLCISREVIREAAEALVQKYELCLEGSFGYNMVS